MCRRHTGFYMGNKMNRGALQQLLEITHFLVLFYCVVFWSDNFLPLCADKPSVILCHHCVRSAVDGAFSVSSSPLHAIASWKYSVTVTYLLFVSLEFYVSSFWKRHIDLFPPASRCALEFLCPNYANVATTDQSRRFARGYQIPGYLALRLEMQLTAVGNC